MAPLFPLFHKPHQRQATVTAHHTTAPAPKLAHSLTPATVHGQVPGAVHGHLPVVTSTVLAHANTTGGWNAALYIGILALLVSVAAALIAVWQLRQARRTTNMDIALRLLERIDSFYEIENSIANRKGFADFAAFALWLITIGPEGVKKFDSMIRTYETAGLVLRTMGDTKATKMLARQLAHVCPALFDSVRAYILEGRRTSLEAFADFQWLADRCRQEESRLRAAPRGEKP